MTKDENTDPLFTVDRTTSLAEPITIGAGGGGSMTTEHADLALALAVHSGIRDGFRLTEQEKAQVKRGLAVAERIHGERDMKCPNCGRAWDNLSRRIRQCFRCGTHACMTTSEYKTSCVLAPHHEGQHDDDTRSTT